MKRLSIILVLLTSLMSLSANASSNVVYADVNGLVCDFCAQALEKVFGKQEEVESIDVDLDTKVITIAFVEGESMDDDAISELITDSGYDVRAIRRD